MSKYKWDDEKYKSAASKRQKQWHKEHPEHAQKVKASHDKRYGKLSVIRSGQVEMVTEAVVITKPRCPYTDCLSTNTVRHGFTNDKQRYRCNKCKRHFT